MKFQQIARTVAFASALLASAGAFPASDGTLGADSTAEITISLNIEERVQVSGLDDIALGTYAGTGDLEGASSFCVYRNGSGLFDLTVTSTNADGGAFRATDGTDFIAYTVRVDDSIDASRGRRAASGSTVTGLSGSGSSTNCGGAEQAALAVTFSEAALQAAPSGNFSDVIVVRVEPSDRGGSGEPVRLLDLGGRVPVSP